MDNKIRYTLEVKESLPKEDILEIGLEAFRAYREINQTVVANKRIQKSGDTILIISVVLAVNNLALIMTYDEFQKYREGGNVDVSYHS